MLEVGLSPASVRNVMADLEDLGLIARTAYLGRPGADAGRVAVFRRRHARGRRGGRTRAQPDRQQSIEGQARQGQVEDVLTEASQLAPG
jgi:heat-inducible transcriptional repressor